MADSGYILIVDDEKGIRFGLRNLFSRNGYTVFEADSIDSAVAVARKEVIDVALLDIQLENGESGLDLLRRLKSINDDIQAIMITGFGKEVMARYIHFTGNRRNGNFVSLNSASISESLLLSELFGHAKGAFPGAVSQKAGMFEIADGDTLFLDEIGDMPVDIQAKLLRVIEERSFQRVGGVKKYMWIFSLSRLQIKI